MGASSMDMALECAEEPLRVVITRGDFVGKAATVLGPAVKKKYRVQVDGVPEAMLFYSSGLNPQPEPDTLATLAVRARGAEPPPTAPSEITGGAMQALDHELSTRKNRGKNMDIRAFIQAHVEIRRHTRQMAAAVEGGAAAEGAAAMEGAA